MKFRLLFFAFKNRQKLLGAWNRAVRFLSGNESRIRVESQRIAGEDFEVWRWIQVATPKAHSPKSARLVSIHTYHLWWFIHILVLCQKKIFCLLLLVLIHCLASIKGNVLCHWQHEQVKRRCWSTPVMIIFQGSSYMNFLFAWARLLVLPAVYPKISAYLCLILQAIFCLSYNNYMYLLEVPCGPVKSASGHS